MTVVRSQLRYDAALGIPQLACGNTSSWERMSANGRVYEPSPTRTASWQRGVSKGSAHPAGASRPINPTAHRLRQSNPTGKISLSPSGKSLLGLTPSCPRERGVGHRHRTLGWDAVDAAVSGVKFVRRAVSVSGQRRAGRTMPKRTVKSCGPDASVVGVKSAEGKSARPGAEEPAIRRRRRQQSPILRGEREVSRNAIAQGMPECLR
jgi:hypothetical protein